MVPAASLGEHRSTGVSPVARPRRPWYVTQVAGHRPALQRIIAAMSPSPIAAGEDTGATGRMVSRGATDLLQKFPDRCLHLVKLTGKKMVGALYPMNLLGLGKGIEKSLNLVSGGEFI